MSEGAVPILLEYETNHMFTSFLKKGGGSESAEKALADSDVVVAGTFVSPRIAHLTIEPDNAMAFIDENDRITIMSRTVAVHHHLMMLSMAIGVARLQL
jgi:CO/xanthine dehydrogenase Mo-binding subunit